MSSPKWKRKKTKEKPSLKQSPPVLEPTPKSTQNPSLPDDLLLSCFARASRLQYPTLSLVSKRFGSLLASPELYKTRSSLGRTESCLYVCLRFHPDPIPRWFTLCRKPNRAQTPNVAMKKQLKKMRMMPSGYALAKVSTPHSRSAHWSALVAVGSEIYNIGGPVGEANEPSSSVSILDCRSNTWRQGPRLLVKRMYPFANVVDGKVYVAGSFDSSSPQWMEVFDPKTQTWELVPIPVEGIRLEYIPIYTTVGIDGKLFLFQHNTENLAYDTSEGRWESVEMDEMSSGWYWFSYCVVENVLYHFRDEKILWFDTEGRRWRVLKVVNRLPTLPFDIRLADYGGKLAVLWDRFAASTGYTEKMICCAVIALQRRSDYEILGMVEWSDAVLIVPMSCRIERALAATV